MSLQSCNVYYANTATIDEAIHSSDKVKIKSPDHNIYKFEKITKVDQEIYVLAKKKSSTTNDLNNQVIWKNSDSKNLSILLTDKNISTIHLKNKSASTIVSIVIPVVALSAVIGIAALAADNSGIDIGGEWGGH
mgnify:CR=1 FL=1